MRRDVHHDNRFFTLWFLWLNGFRRRLGSNRFWLRRLYGFCNRLWCLRCDGLLSNVLWRLGRRLRLYHRRSLRLLYRLRRRYRRGLCRLMRLLCMRLLYRLWRARRLRRLTLVRRLVLVLRRVTRGFMLPSSPRGVIDLVDTNFTHAFNIVIEVFFRFIIGITRLHSLHWTIAEHR
ncbi:hypothetical protein KATP_12370 [Kluyvera ascorbata]|nr:hypothetical protein KATP_12370 [Kluyvera ascorbata]